MRVLITDVREADGFIQVDFDSVIGSGRARWGGGGKQRAPRSGLEYSVEINLHEDPDGFALARAEEYVSRIELHGEHWHVNGRVEGVDEDGVFYLRVGSGQYDSISVILEPVNGSVAEGEWLVAKTKLIVLYDTGYILHN
ncbi:MAG: hypothetical protein ACIAQF_13275 [Phycisphaerales bacterium JB065]